MSDMWINEEREKFCEWVYTWGFGITQEWAILNHRYRVGDDIRDQFGWYRVCEVIDNNTFRVVEVETYVNEAHIEPLP